MGCYSYEKAQERGSRVLKRKRQFPRKCVFMPSLTGTRQNFDGERHEANRIFTGIPGGYVTP